MITNQYNQWVSISNENKVFQSMSRKATCADNAAVENFFGILKQEIFYGEKLVRYDELISRFEEYMYWYNQNE